ncbi:MAG: hypothetical protein AAGP08_00900 [Pseudomonadota bacterium]
MHFLSEEQRSEFAKINARLGLGPEEFTVDADEEMNVRLPETDSTEIRMSSSGGSDFTPHIMPVASIEDLRHIIDPPTFGHLVEGETPKIPAPIEEVMSAEALTNVSHLELRPHITPELLEHIKEAATVFAFGDAAAVETYTTLINAALYPGKLAAFTGPKLVVPPGKKLVITGEDPVMLNFGEITMSEGAELVVHTQFSINCQKFGSA